MQMRKTNRMFICDISHDGMQRLKTFHDWPSFKGRIWHKYVLHVEDGTEALIRYFRERNVVWICERTFLWWEHCVTFQNTAGERTTKTLFTVSFSRGITIS